MANRLFFIVFILVLSVMSISFSAAQITLNDLNETYSLGDNLKTELSIIESDSIEGIISLKLICDSYDFSFFVTSVKLNANELKKFNVEPLKLTQDGTCQVTAELRKANSVIDFFKTGEFSISSSLSIDYKFNKDHFLPGERLEVSGEVKKADNNLFSGAGTLGIDGKNSTENIKGKFNFNNALDSKIRSGSHPVLLYFADENGNSGFAEKNIFVEAVPTKIEIDMEKSDFFPNETLSAEIILSDQAGDQMNNSITVTVYNSWGVDTAVFVLNGQTLNYNISRDSAPGNWWIYAYGEGMKERKFFYIEELESIDAEIINNTLKVKNIGNVAYQKPMDVVFSSEADSTTETIILDIPVNGEVIYKLNAPDGDYNLTVKGESLEKSFFTPLTGNAISIKSSSLKDKAKEIIVAAFLIAVLVFSVLARIKSPRRINVSLSNRE